MGFMVVLFQDFGQLFLQFVAVQASCQDDAFAVNQYRVWYAAYGIQGGTFTIPIFQVGHLGPSDVQLFDAFLPGFRITVQ